MIFIFIRFTLFFNILLISDLFAITPDVDLTCDKKDESFFETVISHLEKKNEEEQDPILLDEENVKKCPNSLHAANVDDLIEKIIKNEKNSFGQSRENYRREWDHKCRNNLEFCIRLAEAIDWKESTFTFPVKDTDGIYKHRAFSYQMIRPSDYIRDLRHEIYKKIDDEKFNTFANVGNGFLDPQTSQLQLSYYYNNIKSSSQSKEGKLDVVAYGTWLYYLPSFAPFKISTNREENDFTKKLVAASPDKDNPLSCPVNVILDNQQSTQNKVMAAKRCEAVMRKCKQFRIGTDYFDTKTGTKVNTTIKSSYTSSSIIADKLKSDELGLAAFALKQENGKSYVYKKNGNRWTKNELSLSLLSQDQKSNYMAAEKNLKAKFLDNPKLLSEFLPHVMAAHINNHPYFVYGTGIYLKDGTPADPRAIYPYGNSDFNHNENIHEIAAYLNKQQSFLNLFDNEIYSFKNKFEKNSDFNQRSVLLDSGFFISDINDFFKKHLGIVPGTHDLIQTEEQLQKIANGILTGENFYRLSNGEVYMIKDDKLRFVNKKLSFKDQKEIITKYYGNRLGPDYFKYATVFPVFYDDRFKEKLAYAMLNHKYMLEYNGKIYNLNCFYLEKICVHNFEMPIQKANYPDLFLERSLASKDPVYLEKYWESTFMGDPYFVHNKKIYDANSGHPVNTIKVPEINLRMNSKKRERYAKLSQKDVVINYSMTTPTCESGRFAIIDKKKSVIEYYSSLTNELFQSLSLDSGHANRQEDKNSLCPAGVFKLNTNLRYWAPSQQKGSCLYDKNIRTDFLGANCRVIVLPSDDKVEFKLKNNELALYVNDLWANESWYHNPGVKNLAVTGEIFYKIDPNQPYSLEATTFRKTLLSQKQNFIRNYNISSEDYDDLMMTLFGILHTESKNGTHPRFYIKETFPDLVAFYKSLKGDNSANSRGPAQVKPTNLTALKGSHLQAFEAYLRNSSEIDPEKKSSEWLAQPENNAITSMALLIDAYQNLIETNKKDLKANAFYQVPLVQLTTYIYNNPGMYKSGDITPHRNNYLNETLAASHGFTLYAIDTKGHINTNHLSDEMKQDTSAPVVTQTNTQTITKEKASSKPSAQTPKAKPTPAASKTQKVEPIYVKQKDEYTGNVNRYCRIFCRGKQQSSFPNEECLISASGCRDCFLKYKKEEEAKCK